MSRALEISDFSFRKNSGSYVTDTATTYQLSDTLDIRLTMKNTSTSTKMRAWTVKLSWMYDSNVVGTPYTVYDMTAITELGCGKSRTVTITGSGISVKNTGVTTTSNANSLKVEIYGWYSETPDESDDPYWYGSYTSTLMAFKGESHQPRIDAFSIKRNGNESAQLKLVARGSYGTTLPSTVTFGESVLFEVSLDGGDWETMTTDTITVSALLAGVDRVMTYTLPTSSQATFRLSFYNAYEAYEPSVTEVGRAFANIHLKGSADGGVAFGMFCDGGDTPRFECAYPAYFYGGIAEGVETREDIAEGETVIGTFLGETLYRYVHVIEAKSSGATTITLPIDGTIKNVVRASGAAVMTIDSASWAVPLNTYYSSSIRAYVRVKPADNQVLIYGGSAITGGFLIVDYTKE